MGEEPFDWDKFWLNVIRGLEDSRRVLQTVLVLISAGSGALALYLHFSEREKRE